ncbi:N-acyl homoserine lactonase family protein [Nocardia sp. CA-151230]|uniref:N-acyl homoserine lactonase family protein n=1 Tax=Nocardia sp. CA-151230 TaxID=3239982 RepID=UPI003D8FB3AB
MTVKLYAFTVGHMTLPTLMLLADRPGYTRVPVTSYLIDHPRGRAVFDTGLNIKAQNNPGEYVGDLLASLHEFDYSAGEDIGSRLAEVDVDPTSITYIINSHLHFDHCGGNELLSNATVVVQRPEIVSARGEDSQYRGYLSTDFETGQTFQVVDGEHDLFGDGSVVLIPTYGHTPGHQSVRVRTERGEFILCGDACYLKETLDTMTLPGVITDPDGFTRSLSLLRRLQSAGATIMYGHDLEFWETVPKAPARLG